MQFPSYMGLTGPMGIGTDDINYYAGLNAKITYPLERVDIAMGNTLSPLINLLYLPHIYDPIDIVVFNILGIAFIPYMTNRICCVFGGNEKIALTSEQLILFCPFLMSVGLIIMRDVLCTSIILLSFLCFAKKKYLIFVGSTTILIYLKFGFLVFLVVIIALYLLMQERIKNRSQIKTLIKIMAVTVALLFAFVLYIIPNLSEITGGRLTSESLFREDFVEYLHGSNEDSVLVKIYDMPILLRIPMLVVAFLVLPPLSPSFIREGHFMLGAFMSNFAAPVYWCILYRYLFEVILSYRKMNVRVKTIINIVSFLALTLGIISLQYRHKVVMMPFLYIAIAYAVNSKIKPNQFLVLGCTFIFTLAQVYFFYSHL